MNFGTRAIEIEDGPCLPEKRSREVSPFSRYCMTSLSPIILNSDLSFTALTNCFEGSAQEETSKPEKTMNLWENLEDDEAFLKENTSNCGNAVCKKKSNRRLQKSIVGPEDKPKVCDAEDTQIMVKKGLFWKKGKVNSKGCNCKRGCLKKYCDCFRMSGMCTEACRCTGCMNTEATFPFKLF